MLSYPRIPRYYICLKLYVHLRVRSAPLDLSKTALTHAQTSSLDVQFRQHTLREGSWIMEINPGQRKRRVISRLADGYPLSRSEQINTWMITVVRLLCIHLQNRVRIIGSRAPRAMAVTLRIRRILPFVPAYAYPRDIVDGTVVNWISSSVGGTVGSSDTGAKRM